VALKSYSDHDIPVVGESTVHVQYNGQEADLPVIITEGDGIALMGRDWLSTLKLNWKEISQVYETTSPSLWHEFQSNETTIVRELSSSSEISFLAIVLDLVQQYPVLFDGELGIIKGVTAKLVVKENATPRYFKPRPVPYTHRDKVAAELSRLEKKGVLKKVESSDWATPIVQVLKPD